MVLFRVTLIEASMIRITLVGIVVVRRTAVERTMLLLMNTSFSTVLVLREFLSLEWMKPIVEKFRSDAALDVAILKKRTATLCKSTH
jgi:hypothetical protein